MPYTKVFQPPDEVLTATDNVLLHGNLTSLSPSVGQEGKPALGRGIASYIPLDINNTKKSDSKRDIHFDYLIYALGSQLPPPINIWSTVEKDNSITSEPQVEDAKQFENANQAYEEKVTILQTRGSKAAGVKWLKETQDQIRKADSILVIGGGALGVRESDCGRKTDLSKKAKRLTIDFMSPQIRICLGYCLDIWHRGLTSSLAE